MNLAYLVAGILAVMGAAIHGGVGEALLVRRLDPESLPRTRMGGGETSLRLIRGTWHLVTFTFAVFGVSLAVCGARGAGATCEGAGTLIAVTSSGFAAMAVGGALASRGPRGLVRHPAPLMLSAVAILAWIGT